MQWDERIHEKKSKEEEKKKKRLKERKRNNYRVMLQGKGILGSGRRTHQRGLRRDDESGYGTVQCG